MATIVIHQIKDWRQLQLENKQKFADKTLGFVPTMGNLHDGHASLLKQSAAENQLTVLSIFVNPTQFDQAKDLEYYPKTLEQDLALAEKLNIDFVFVPTYTELYPDNYNYKISESILSKQFCGQHRPGHFDGMLTVVLKLLLIFRPNRAYFGEKDLQQLNLVQGMTKSFFVETDIIACPTIRDTNGLALSSRNHQLDPDEYELATQFATLLRTKLSDKDIHDSLEWLGFSVDYIQTQGDRRFGAVRIGKVRLIDNVQLLHKTTHHKEGTVA